MIERIKAVPGISWKQILSQNDNINIYYIKYSTPISGIFLQECFISTNNILVVGRLFLNFILMQGVTGNLTHFTFYNIN